MKIHQQHLNNAVKQAIIDQQQADNLWQFLQTQSNTASFSFTHVLYYLGGLIAIGAMTLFMNLGWETLGGLGIFIMSLIYAVIGLTLTELFKRRGYPIPAGVCATFVVLLTPLATYGLILTLNMSSLLPEDMVYRDYHDYMQWQWLYLELATLVVATLMLWRYRYTFLVMPVAATLWYMSMDLGMYIYADPYAGFDARMTLSVYFGIAMGIVALLVDIISRRRQSADYAFWLYLFAVMTFWFGLSFQYSDSEWNKFDYAIINVALILIGAILLRKVFVVFGGIGLTGYLSYLSYNVFSDSALFPVVLTVIGFAVIGLGIVWQKNEQTISQHLRAVLPQSLQVLLPPL